MYCTLFAFRYGWTIGSPKCVVQMTAVIDSLGALTLRVLPEPSTFSSWTALSISDKTLCGMDLESSLADVVNHS